MRLHCMPSLLSMLCTQWWRKPAVCTVLQSICRVVYSMYASAYVPVCALITYISRMTASFIDNSWFYQKSLTRRAVVDVLLTSYLLQQVKLMFRLTCSVLLQVSIMSAIRHPNVVLFMGVCLDPPCMVTEVCPLQSTGHLASSSSASALCLTHVVDHALNTDYSNAAP